MVEAAPSVELNSMHQLVESICRLTASHLERISGHAGLDGVTEHRQLVVMRSVAGEGNFGLSAAGKVLPSFDTAT